MAGTIKIGKNNNIVPYNKRTAYASSIKIPATTFFKYDLPGFQLNIKIVAKDSS